MKISCIAVLVLLMAAASFAQAPRAALSSPVSDIYVGYVATFPDYGAHFDSLRFDGVEVAYTENFRPHFALTAAIDATFGGPYSAKQVSGTIGPKINLLTGRFRPYITGQIGFALQNSNGMYAADHHPPVLPGASLTEDGFTYRFGGGMDVQLRHKLYWRVLQWDYQPQPWGRHTPFYQNWGSGLGYHF
jgi:hypothetical protein